MQGARVDGVQDVCLGTRPLVDALAIVMAHRELLVGGDASHKCAAAAV